MKRSGLGRGLASLIPDAAGEGDAAGVPLDQIHSNPYQPRREFDDDALAELAASIKEHGLLQPVALRRDPGGEGFQIIAGERRCRACRLAGLAAVPAVVRDCTDREMLEIALVENLQREDLNPIEAAEAYRRCLEEFGLTQEELAQRIGKSRTAVANTLRLLKLAEPVRQAVAAGELSEGHGRALLGLVEPDDQAMLARRIQSEGLTVRDTEQLVREWRGRPAKAERVEPREAPELDPDLAAFAERLRRAFGTRLELRPNKSGGGGSIVIRYYDDEDLMRIAEALEG